VTNASGSFTQLGMFGDGQSIAKTTANSITKVYMFGFSQRMKNTLDACTPYVGMYGFDNEVDGCADQDPAIYGQSNIVHGLQDCFGGLCNGLAQDTTVVGNQNTITNVGTGMAVGIGNSLTNCTGCMILGYGVSLSTANTVAIGAASQQILFTAGNVRRVPVAFSTLPACAAGTEGSFAAINDSTTTTIGATITGGSSGHVLGYCAGTNWKVAAN
jgi:hypothetical protein